jgi:DNA-binding XRE family transcriptional regulator
MAFKRPHGIDCRRVELDGVRYVILRESAFEWLCRKAGVDQEETTAAGDSNQPGLDMDRATLAEKLARRRRACGLSQADLARRAGIRAETLNRIERGHTTPDFATVRKLVIAMNAAEHEGLGQDDSGSSGEEPKHAAPE